MTTRAPNKRWSRDVMKHSHALELEPAAFKGSAAQIARSLKRSAERSNHRKATPFRSALSMITFYVNRAGSQLSGSRKRVLERAKDELRKLYGRSPRARSASPSQRRRSPG
jgi:cob(I)alamin adenosyltransferase